MMTNNVGWGIKEGFYVFAMSRNGAVGSHHQAPTKASTAAEFSSSWEFKYVCEQFERISHNINTNTTLWQLNNKCLHLIEILF